MHVGGVLCANLARYSIVIKYYDYFLYTLAKWCMCSPKLLLLACEATPNQKAIKPTLTHTLYTVPGTRPQAILLLAFFYRCGQ